MAMVTFKIQRTATPAYLSRHLQPCNCVKNLRSSDTPLLCQPFTKTDLARRGFRYSAPAIWNSHPRTVLESPSITVFKSRLKTHFFDLARVMYAVLIPNSNDVTCATIASEVTTNGGIEICILLLLLLLY